MGKPQNRTAKGDELHKAARNGDLSAVNSILATNPLAVNSRDKHSRTPLHLAAWSGQVEVVSYLCKNKADVGAAAMDDMGAIHFAAQKGHLEVVRTLISHGGSIKASTRKGMTPLHYAVQGSHFELVKYLAKKGGDLNAKTKAGMRPFDLASNDEIRSFLEEHQTLAKKGDLNSNEKIGESASKPSEVEKADDEVIEAGDDEEWDTKLKRKSDDKDGAEEASLETKRPRVALGHLMSADDIGDDEENS